MNKVEGRLAGINREMRAAAVTVVVVVAIATSSSSFVPSSPTQTRRFLAKQADLPSTPSTIPARPALLLAEESIASNNPSMSSMTSVNEKSSKGWVRALVVFGLGYALGGFSAPGWERHRQISSKVNVSRILLILLLSRNVWTSLPSWAKPHLMRRLRSARAKLKSVFVSSSGEGVDEDESDDDNDDLTSMNIFASKFQSLMTSVRAKMDLNEMDQDKFGIDASFMATIQLLDQIKSRKPELRDDIYKRSGNTVSASSFRGLDEMLELADLAYDEHKDGDIKTVLRIMGYDMIKHDKTEVPGYLGHYVALKTDEKTAIIGIKGTSGLEDLLTDLCGSSVEYDIGRPFYDGGGTSLRCHEGIFLSSTRLVDELDPLVKNLLVPSDYKIIVTGHSLGAAGSIMLGILLRSRIRSLQQSEEKLKVYAFAPPPILDSKSSEASMSFVTTVVNNCDCVPRANIGPALTTLKFLKRVDTKLKLKNLDMSNFRSTMAFLNKMGEGADGEMIMSFEEIATSVDDAIDSAGVEDPDYLYVPGRVILMYTPWETDKKSKGDSEQINVLGTIRGWLSEFESSELLSNKEKVGTSVDKEFRAIECSGTSDALRFVELGTDLIEDHMAYEYRASIASFVSKSSESG